MRKNQSLPDDLTNQRFGKLTAKSVTKLNGKRAWTCLCDCGGELIVDTSMLRAGLTLRCKNCRIPDLLGKRSGKLVVIKRIGRVNGSWRWLCQCDCGGTIELPSERIQKELSDHCGCLSQERMGGCRLPENMGAWNTLYCDYRCNGKNKDFTLSKDEFLILCKQDCHYCGSQPKRLLRGTLSVYFNGIDRKDNELGYTVENCVPCCTRCNFMKRSLSYEEFLETIRAIYQNRLEPLPTVKEVRHSRFDSQLRLNPPSRSLLNRCLCVPLLQNSIG